MTSGPGRGALPRALRACTISARNGMLEQPDQIAEQHDAADEHADERKLPALVTFLDLAGHAANAVAKLFLGNEDFHGEVPCW